MSSANYNGRLTNSGFSKFFVEGGAGQYWKPFKYINSPPNTISVLTPTYSGINDLYIPGDIYIDGSVINTSDAYLKDNISSLNKDKINKLMNLQTKQFTFKDDSSKQIHYGFIAQEFEKEYPELVSMKPDKTLKNIKAINYLEIIPLLVNKIQLMQEEINELKCKLN
jgi:hypothetical protein